VVLVDRVAQFDVVGVLHVLELGPYPDHEKLSYLFFRRHFVESFLRPFFAVAVELDGPGALVLFFGCGKTKKE
jgi:hypothetical protein